MNRRSVTVRCALICAAALLAFPAPSPAPLPTRPERPPEPPGEALSSEQPAREQPPSGQPASAGPASEQQPREPRVSEQPPSAQPPGERPPSAQPPGERPPSAQPPSELPIAAQDPLLGPGLVYAAGQYLGPGSCAASGCHGNAAPARTYDVLQNEWSIWNHQDKHRHAFDPLWNARSAQIARNLKLSRPAAESPLCLACHVLRAPASVQAIALEVADGVSCESCHGPAGGWFAQHNEAGWTHADSLAAGMIDLRQPRLRARLCLGCHQGDRRRQVDHELLAAGHPELVFELDNYTESMPAHWLPYSERNQDREPGELGDSHGLRAWAVGQVESFRAGLELLAHRARSDRWPEFAEMTCDSCHHDLADGAWRQRRGYRQRAGMPAFSPARYAVLRQVVAAVASPAALAELDSAVEEVAAAVANLGAPPEQLLVASQRAVSLLGNINARVENTSWQGRAARDLLAAILANRAGAPGADRQSAEQTALAIQSLTEHLKTTNPHLARGKPARLVRQLFAALDQPYGYDRERFVSLLGELETEIR